MSAIRPPVSFVSSSPASLNTALRVPAAAQTGGELLEGRGHYGRPHGMANRRHAANDETGGGAHEIGIGAADLLAEKVRKLCLVDRVTPEAMTSTGPPS